MILSPTSATSSAHTKHLFLIDGYGFVFRAYHSLPPMTRSDGTPVNAVYGFTNMLLKLRAQIETSNKNNPEDHYMAVVFDSGRKSFRNDIYAEYKANRPPAPEDLIPQFALIRKAADALQIPALECEGYEADDLIATYTRIAREDGAKITIVSSDKDLMQLVDENVNLFDAMKEKIIGEKEVVEKFGVPPSKVLDVLALMGDSSDNIPGVPGIGPKTAAELVQQFGSLDQVLTRAGEVKQNKRRESLIAFADQARLSQKLAALEANAPCPLELSSLAMQPMKSEPIRDFLKENNFKSLLARIEQQHAFPVARPIEQAEKTPAAPVASAPVISTTVTEIKTVAELRTWVKSVESTGQLAVLHTREKDGTLHFHLALDESRASHFTSSNANAAAQNLFDVSSTPKDALPFSEVSSTLMPLIADRSLITIGHDIKSLLVLMDKANAAQAVDDVELMSYVLDGAVVEHTIPALVSRTLPVEPASPALALIALHRVLKARLVAEQMTRVYEGLERPLIPVLAAVEKKGVFIDTEMLRLMSHDFAQTIQRLEHEIYALAGMHFNIGSPKQMGEVLFDKMQLPGGKKSKKTGAYGTDAGVLEELVEQGHAIARKILQWRMLSKLKSTYTDALGTHINPETKRIHTTFQMTVTSTGRLSSQYPNLQNIPVRSEEGKKIRNAFIAEPGNTLLSADYSQIELRLLAHMADIPALKEAFAKNVDIHALTASQVLGVPLEKVDANMRRSAKAINFGIIYGQSAFGLAAGLGIPRTDAARYIEAYFRQYPGIAEYMERTKEFAREQGYVLTIFGRKCYMPGIKDKGPARQFAERAAINAPLQGTAADIIKRAMIALDRSFRVQNMTARMVLQVHDELLVEAPHAETEAVKALMKSTMESAASLSVPLVVEVASGNNWGEIH
ncbi:MAG: DNA polymerase I [Proteobacteria bacterium]|nr:DNA polymerase I [Pseudomonadota bacterium]